MSDWTAGYVADIGYTYGYYAELNPLRSQLAFLTAGLAAPATGQGVHCELGFGQGMSVNIHAAAGDSAWYATDFNPGQAGFAQSLAQASGASAFLYDEAFADFCARPDLPEFDSIGLHGIWSWISDANRAVIVDFVRRKLKVGGVLYISYNTQPGWAAMVPLRDLLTEHANMLGVPGKGIVNRIDEALSFAERLIATDPLYARTNPGVAERLKGVKQQNRNYLAHEYFNRDWLPMSFARMREWLAPTKLEFACSANYHDGVEALNLSAEQQQLLAEIPDPMFRQTVRDFCVNQQFRRDYWVKGARRLKPLQQREAFQRTAVMLIQPRNKVAMKVNSIVGESRLQEAVYAPLLDCLADYQPKSVGELELALAGKLNLGQLVQAIQVLIGNGAVQPALVEVTASAAQKAKLLNEHLIDLARSSADIGYLASPVTAGGISLNRIQQRFLAARSQGLNKPEEWAGSVWQLLSAQGQRMVKDGKALDTAEANLAELAEQAQVFATEVLPIVEALQIA